MKMTHTRLLLALLSLLSILAGCAGTQTFGTAARAGDTVTLQVGMQANLKRQNMTVTITPASGAPIVYLPYNPNVVAVVNLYPDPASLAHVGIQTQQDLGVAANTTTGGLIKTYVTPDSDWWQTTVLLNLPSSLPTGMATITMVDSAGEVIRPISVEVVPGIGATNNFTIYTPWGGTIPIIAPTTFPLLIKSMERADGYTVTFTGATIPHSIGVQFTHTPTVGKTWVVNPRGDIKNVTWTDDGSTLKVMVNPTDGQTLTQMIDFKFYVAGGITALTQVPSSLKAYDINGNLMAGAMAWSSLRCRFSVSAVLAWTGT